jgi:nucleoside-diphosphate-sugar epimerase
MTPLPPISRDDREHIVRHTTEIWRGLAGANFFITGGTGFYGKWLLESIAAGNDLLGGQARATILSRNPARFAAEVPHLATRREFSWQVGDAASFTFPDQDFDYVLHFATASAAEIRSGGTAIIMQTLRGTERVLQFARTKGVKRLLFASSGAIYGPQPADLSHIPEDYRGCPDPSDPASAYGEMKRISEALCVSSGVDCVITRGFSFLGPYLPLTDKFAAGSFIRDALAGGPVRMHGDGTPVRSYLYAADLAIWLLAILVRGRSGIAYNLGSDQSIELSRLASLIAERALAACTVERQRNHGNAMDRYVPDVSRARHELGLTIGVGLESAIERSVAYARSLGAGEPSGSATTARPSA